MIKKILQDKDVFLTSAQAAEFLNVSLSTLKKIINQYNIKTLKTPGGHYRIRKKDLLEKIYEKED